MHAQASGCSILGDAILNVAGDCCADGKLTDMLSFYTLPSTVIGNPTYKTLKAAFMYYTVAKTTPLQQLMTDALILACKTCDAPNLLQCCAVQPVGSFHWGNP